MNSRGSARRDTACDEACSEIIGARGRCARHARSSRFTERQRAVHGTAPATDSHARATRRRSAGATLSGVRDLRRPRRPHSSTRGPSDDPSDSSDALRRRSRDARDDPSHSCAFSSRARVVRSVRATRSPHERRRTTCSAADHLQCLSPARRPRGRPDAPACATRTSRGTSCADGWFGGNGCVDSSCRRETSPRRGLPTRVLAPRPTQNAPLQRPVLGLRRRGRGGLRARGRGGSGATFPSPAGAVAMAGPGRAGEKTGSAGAGVCAGAGAPSVSFAGRPRRRLRRDGCGSASYPGMITGMRSFSPSRADQGAGRDARRARSRPRARSRSLDGGTTTPPRKLPWRSRTRARMSARGACWRCRTRCYTVADRTRRGRDPPRSWMPPFSDGAVASAFARRRKRRPRGTRRSHRRARSGV